MQENFKRRIIERFMDKKDLAEFERKYEMFKSPTLSGYVQAGVIIEERVTRYDR